ncbi:MAG: hypothetical protein HYY01_07260 [Chloroflexi bacterium]|nr:hypothetical protein [Chloroflexota bacterium]
MVVGQPWHVPSKWFAVPTYWEPEVAARGDLKHGRVRFIDCTLREGEDATGCHLGWAKRIEITRALDDLGVGEITVPGGAAYREQKDYIRWCKTHGIKAPISVKGPGTRVPLRPDWKEVYKRHIDMGGESIVPIIVTSAQDVFSDYAADGGKAMVIDVIQQVTSFSKREGATVIVSLGDPMRHRLDTIQSFYGAAIEAGADGIYVWDSRGNSHPAATAHYVRSLRQTIGDKPFYIQFHNDLGLATGNCLVAAENGADWLDASVLGVGDRGGVVALEEAAAALALYGVDTGIKLDRLYDTCKLVEVAFGVTMHPWKPIAGALWPTEPGWGHWEAGDAPETPIGIAAEVVGRRFENVIAPTVFFGRYPTFVSDVLQHWGYPYTEADVAEIIERAKSSVMTHRTFITLAEFQEVCKGVLGIP